MFTRCQACHTVHPLNAALLAQGGGRYRCAKCNKIGNALEALFDEWPEAGQKGIPPGDLPTLGVALTLDPPDEDFATAEEAALLTDPDRARRNPLQRTLWITAALVLLVIITLNLASFFQKPLLEHASLQSTLIALGVKQAPPEPLFRDLDQIELVSREMKAHPSRPGVLLLTATIVNRAGRSQAYPDIDVTLVDVRGRKLERQLFSPGDYLSRTSEMRIGMTPDAYLTFSLEMVDPGNEAVGFELQFR